MFTKGLNDDGIAIIAIVVLFGLFTFILWNLGFLTLSGTDATKITVASLAFLSGFLASVASIVGFVLKHSADRRTESRLGVEASMRAVQLLATEDGKPAPRIQLSGALYALSSLNQHDLALTLGFLLFPTDQIDADAFAAVVDKALKTADREVKDRAFSNLIEVAPKLVTERGISLPPALLGDVKLTEYTQNRLPVLIGNVAMALSPDIWRNRRGQFFVLLAILGTALQKQPKGVIRNNMVLVLNELVAPFPEVAIVNVGGRDVNIQQFRTSSEATDPQPATGEVAQMIRQLRTLWRSDVAGRHH
jgi:hypothetical protein